MNVMNKNEYIYSIYKHNQIKHLQIYSISTYLNNNNLFTHYMDMSDWLNPSWIGLTQQTLVL